MPGAITQGWRVAPDKPGSGQPLTPSAKRPKATFGPLRSAYVALEGEIHRKHRTAYRKPLDGKTAALLEG